MIELSTSAKDSPRNASRLESAAPSSSPVDSRTVANRQCWATADSPAAITPKCVWVLPTSTTSSIPGTLSRVERRAAHRHPLAGAECFQRVGQPPGPRKLERRIELEQRDEHEPARREVPVRKRQPLRGVFERVEQQHIDVDRPRSVPGSARRATELA